MLTFYISTSKLKVHLVTLIGIVLTSTGLSFGQTVITQWNFNSTTPDDVLTTGSYFPSVGKGSTATLGGTTRNFGSGVLNGGSSDPAASDNTAMNINTFPTQGTNNNQAGVVFGVKTKGYQKIKLSWDVRPASNSANKMVLFYSTDGTIFTVYDQYQFNPGNVWYKNQKADLSNIAMVEDADTLIFRLVASFADTVYKPSSTNTTYNRGQWRFDMVTVEGEKIDLSVAIEGNSNAIAPASTTTTPSNFTEFETTASNFSSQRTFKIKNTGNRVLSISDVSLLNNSAFSILSVPTSVPVGSQADLVVKFSPTSAGPFTDKVIVQSNATLYATYEFAISGQSESSFQFKNGNWVPSLPTNSDGDFEIPSGYELTIKSAENFTLPAGTKLISSSPITIEAGATALIEGTVQGELTNYGTVTLKGSITKLINRGKVKFR